MTISFKTEDGKEGLLIPLPKDATRLDYDNNCSEIIYQSNGQQYGESLPPANYTLLGVFTKGQPIDFEVREYRLKSRTIGALSKEKGFHDEKVFSDYVNAGQSFFTTKEESFYSLLEKAVKENTVEVNPLVKPNKDDFKELNVTNHFTGYRFNSIKFYNAINNWQEQQNKLRAEKYAVIIKN